MAGKGGDAQEERWHGNRKRIHHALLIHTARGLNLQVTKGLKGGEISGGRWVDELM